MTKRSRFVKNTILYPLLIALLLIGSALSPARATETNVWKFDFGTKARSGYTLVPAAAAYSKTSGYGFVGSNMAPPFLFAVDVPEGNYRVTVKLGDAKSTSTNTIKAEARRLMVENVETKKGKYETRTLLVNVRRPELASGGRVKLKKDEMGHLDWDDQLTLEFNGAQPRVAAVTIEKVDNVPVIYIAGDSTVCDQGKEPWCAWGQMLPRFFDSDIVVANHAESGESLKAFQGEKRNEKMFDTLKAGDYLFIQFGHNDQKPGGAHADAFTTYKELLKKDIDIARARQAFPVLVTSMNRRTFDDAGKIKNSLGDYPEAVRQLAKEENVPLIDLNAMSKVLYETLGPEGTIKAFVHFPADTFPGQDKELKDDTHFTAYGAYEIARCVVEGIRTSIPELKKYLAADVKPFNPAKPDAVESLVLPRSPLSKLETEPVEVGVHPVPLQGGDDTTNSVPSNKL